MSALPADRDPTRRQLSLWPDAVFDNVHARHYSRKQNPYIGSIPWKCRRNEVIRRHNFRCYRCQRERRLQIHPIKYAREAGDEQPEDLAPLCKMCHWTVHQDEQQAQRLFRPCAVV